MPSRPVSEREKFTAFITKYALTTGIFPSRVEDCFHISGDMVSDVSRSCVNYHGNDWHRTEASAKARAEQMRTAKIASLKKQIARLEALKFE